MWFLSSAKGAGTGPCNLIIIIIKEQERQETGLYIKCQLGHACEGVHVQNCAQNVFVARLHTDAGPIVWLTSHQRCTCGAASNGICTRPLATIMMVRACWGGGSSYRTQHSHITTSTTKVTTACGGRVRAAQRAGVATRVARAQACTRTCGCSVAAHVWLHSVHPRWRARAHAPCHRTWSRCRCAACAQ